MSDELVGRIGAAVAGWFVRPANVVVDPPAIPSACEEPIVLAAGDRAALGVGATIALGIARRGVAVVACWRVPAARRRSGLAIAGARRLAASLEARGVEASATGRLVVVALPDDARDAVVLLRRVETACGDAVCVPLLGGPRDEDWDAVLAERGVALLHGADRSVLDLAAARLADQGVDARLLAPGPSALARTLALGGWMPPSTRHLSETVGLA
jgi:hypothetical protein